MLYIPCTDLDALAERVRASVPLEWGPETKDYGMREFGVRDPNGYLLVFAEAA